MTWRRTVLVASLASLSSCSEEKEIHPAPAPVYQTLHHPKLNGAFFHFQHEGKFYLASSKHQGGASPGAKLIRAGQNEHVILIKKVHDQKDLHVWTYDEETLKKNDALNYQSDPKLEVGDRIVFLNRGKHIKATVTQLPTEPNFRFGYETDQPFAANGLSGSPVYLPRLGSVVGVLQTANDKKKARFGGFELLKMP